MLLTVKSSLQLSIQGFHRGMGLWLCGDVSITSTKPLSFFHLFSLVGDLINALNLPEETLIWFSYSELRAHFTHLDQVIYSREFSRGLKIEI